MAEEKKKDFQENAEALEPRVYEIGYLLFPTIREEDLDKEHEALLALITNLKGQKISEGKPQLIDLAYTMSKVIKNKKSEFSQAFFGWIKFEIEPEKIDVLEKELFEIENVLRFLITKTVRENTIYSKNPFQIAGEIKSDKEEIEESVAEEKKEEAKQKVDSVETSLEEKTLEVKEEIVEEKKEETKEEVTEEKTEEVKEEVVEEKKEEPVEKKEEVEKDEVKEK